MLKCKKIALIGSKLLDTVAWLAKPQHSEMQFSSPPLILRTMAPHWSGAEAASTPINEADNVSDLLIVHRRRRVSLPLGQGH